MEIFIHIRSLIFACFLGHGNFFGFTGTIWTYRQHETYGTCGSFTVITWTFKLSVVLGLLPMATSIFLDIVQLCLGQGIKENDLPF